MDSNNTTEQKNRDTARLRKINFEQNSIEPTISLSELCQEIDDKQLWERISRDPDVVFTRKSVQLLNAAVEDHLVRIFQVAQRLAIHSGRQIVRQRDLALAADLQKVFNGELFAHEAGQGDWADGSSVTEDSSDGSGSELEAEGGNKPTDVASAAGYLSPAGGDGSSLEQAISISDDISMDEEDTTMAEVDSCGASGAADGGQNSMFDTSVMLDDATDWLSFDDPSASSDEAMFTGGIDIDEEDDASDIAEDREG